MMYLLSNYAGWLIAALLVGALVSLFTCRGRGPCPGWIVALAAFVIGLIIALLKLLPGRAGLLLDTALLFSAAYMIGCFVGCWLAGLMRDASTTNKSAVSEVRTLKPGALAGPNGGVADDLRLIQGIGPNEEKKLNDNGVYHYAQVADWNAENVAWASQMFGAPGRVEAEQWTPQARVLAAGRDTDYSVLLRAARRRAGEAGGLAGSGVGAATAAGLTSAAPVQSADAVAGPDAGAAKAAAPVVAPPAEGASVGTAASTGLPLAPTGGPVARDAAPATPQIVETAPKPAPAATPVAAQPIAPAAASAPVARPQGGLPLAPADDARPVSAPASAGAASAPAAVAGMAVPTSVAVASAGAAAPTPGPAWSLRAQESRLHGRMPLAPTGGPVAHLTAAVAPLVVARSANPAPAPAAPPAAAPAAAGAAIAVAPKPVVQPAGALPLAPSGAVWSAAAPAPAAPAIEEGPPAPPIDGEEKYAGKRPPGLLGPRGGKADDLKHVKGIGPQNEGRLHGLGVWHFDQIAAWTAEEVLWIGSYLAFPGRIDREKWVEQARLLAQGIETEFSKRAAAGLVPTSKDDGSLGQSNIAHVPKKDD